MTANPTDKLIKNSFVDRMLSFVPDDPMRQSQYIYYLTGIVFIGISCFAALRLYAFITTHDLGALFSFIFMSAVGAMTLIGFKSARNSYKMIKAMKAKPQKTQTWEEMLQSELLQPKKDN